MAMSKRIMTVKVLGYMQPDIDPNTRLYVPFNEGVGGIAKDYSQYNNDAALTDIEWAPNGGKFNGASSYGNCGNDTSLDITDALTIGAWVKYYGDTGIDHSTIVAKGATAGTQWSLYIMTTSNQLRMYGNGGVIDCTEASAFPENSWQYVTFVISGNTGYLYRNTIEVQTDDVTGFDIVNTKKLSIGVRSEGTSGFFKGTIDEVRIYNRVLSAAQNAADCYEVVCK